MCSIIILVHFGIMKSEWNTNVIFVVDMDISIGSLNTVVDHDIPF